MAIIYFGMCHTFTYQNIQNKDRRDFFFLDPNLNYRVSVHDPLFYHNFPFPQLLLQYKAERNMEAGVYEEYDITVTYHHFLNRPEQPCKEEEEKEYNFLECVKTSQARMAGCRPPWDSWSPDSIPLCQSIDQLQQYEKIDMTLLGATRNMKTFVKTTGCQVPCNYKVGVKLPGFFHRIEYYFQGIQNIERTSHWTSFWR